MSKILKIFLITLVSISLPTTSFGNNEVLYLEKGSPAPFQGFLFPKEKAEELRKMNIEFDAIKNINLSLEKSVKLQQDNIELSNNKNKILLDQNDNLAKSLFEARQVTSLEKFLYFGLGVVLTGVTAYGLQKTLINR